MVEVATSWLFLPSPAPLIFGQNGINTLAWFTPQFRGILHHVQLRGRRRRVGLGLGLGTEPDRILGIKDWNAAAPSPWTGVSYWETIFY